MDIFEPEELAKPYQLLVEPCEKYSEAIKLLEYFQARGELTFEADSIAKPLVNHIITVQWQTLEKEGYQEIDARELAEVLGNVGTLAIDEKGTWYLVATMYEKL